MRWPSSETSSAVAQREKRLIDRLELPILDLEALRWSEEGMSEYAMDSQDDGTDGDMDDGWCGDDNDGCLYFGETKSWLGRWLGPTTRMSMEAFVAKFGETIWD